MYKQVESFGRKMMNKIPGLSLKSEPYVDMWGREQKDTNVFSRAAENFLSPSYWESKNVTPVDKEINRLYEKSGETSIIPNTPTGYITNDGKRFDLSATDYTDYKKQIGQTSYNILKNVMSDSDYKKLPDTEKVNLVEKTYEYSRAVAKDDYLDKQGVDFELEPWIETAQKVKDIGVNEGDWMMAYYYLSSAKGKKNKKGDTIDGSQKKARWDIVNEMDISASKKEQIWEILKESYGYK